MMNKINFTCLFFFIFTVNCAISQSILGKWKTVDDRHSLEKAIVEIYRENGSYHGKVVEILEDGKEDATCAKCPGDRRGKPILGMKIIENLKAKDEGEYKGDTLFDPEQAMTFRCKIWLNPENPDELKVRGYLSFLFRTQTWIRVKS